MGLRESPFSEFTYTRTLPTSRRGRRPSRGLATGGSREVVAILRLTATWADQIRQFPLPEEGELHLGSAGDNDLVVPAPGVSRRHARLAPSGSGLLITDLGSKNGLVRDHRRQRRLLLHPGDPEVFLGRAALRLEEVATDEVELALRLDGRPSSGSRTVAETAALLESGAGTPGEALRFVREVERLSAAGALAAHRSTLLWRARRLLGASTLLALRRDAAGRAALAECEGALPAGDLLERLEALAASAAPGAGEGGSAVTVELGGGRTALLVAGGPAGLDLAALRQGVPWEPAAWRGDFLLYLGSRLLPVGPPARGDPASLEPAAAEPGEPRLRFPEGFVAGGSEGFQSLLAELEAVAHGDPDVLLSGETGTGKELFARAIHLTGAGAAAPFVAVNCAAVPAELLEAELFGVEGRVATGVDPRPGRFALADGGTLLLDEIGELEPRLQAKLLRVLQEREVLPLGGKAPRRIQVRVVSATNQDLAARVAAGSFRADLYYRLRGLELRLPALRERPEDLPQLVVALASRAAARHGKRVLGVSRRALAGLLAHPWPGNVRELESAVERAVLRCPAGGTLESHHFPDLQASPPPRAPETGEEPAGPGPERTAAPSPRLLQERVDEVERRAILEALAACDGNKTRAARQLGITRNGLTMKMKRLGIRYREA